MALASLLLFVDPVGGTAFLHDCSDFKTGSSTASFYERSVAALAVYTQLPACPLSPALSCWHLFCF